MIRFFFFLSFFSFHSEWIPFLCCRLQAVRILLPGSRGAYFQLPRCSSSPSAAGCVNFLAMCRYPAVAPPAPPPPPHRPSRTASSTALHSLSLSFSLHQLRVSFRVSSFANIIYGCHCFFFFLFPLFFVTVSSARTNTSRCFRHHLTHTLTS